MGELPVYKFVMETDDFRWFRSNVGTPRCFAGELQRNGQSIPAWIGYRGRFSRYCPKPSFDIWLDPRSAADDAGPLHLNAAFYDPSLLRGRFAFEVMERIGVPCPGARHIWFMLGDLPMGLYTAFESANEHWLRRRGLAADAIYYAVGGRGNFGLLDRHSGKAKRYLTSGYEKAFPDNDDLTDLKALVEAVVFAEDDEFREQIAETLDVDLYLRWHAGLVFASHTDGFVHNYALYKAHGQPWRISPWDCDGTFGRTPSGSRLPATYMQAFGHGSNYLTARLLADPVWRARYVDLFTQLLSDQLTEPVLMEQLLSIYREIRPHVLADERKLLSNSTFQREPNRIRHYIRERIAFLQAQLSEAAMAGATM
ncbi:MAG TPA: CotH kinase family protein [Symbiobacteriaceae bacterium]|jgi:spore coat protein H|nr:CotH kinase family protein [Symbiobacteriaceae bacterium]